MRIGTWNIRAFMLKDLFSKRNWFLRLPLIIKTIKEENPDIMCFQEVHGILQRYTLLMFLRGYKYAYKRSKGDWNIFSMENGIAYKKDVFDIFFTSGRNLSDNGQLNGNRWGAKEHRSYCIAMLKHKNGKPVNVACTHFDPYSEESKIGSSKIINSLFYNVFNVFLCGDFNFTPQCVGYKIMTESWKDAQEGHQFGTANKWKYDTPPADHRIDYIFTNSKVEEIYTIPVMGKTFPSDHCPIFANIKL